MKKMIKYGVTLGVVTLAVVVVAATVANKYLLKAKGFDL
jgi:hypothetical protein